MKIAKTKLFSFAVLAGLIFIYDLNIFGESTSGRAASAAVSDSLNKAAYYIGNKTCATCHQIEYKAWRGSHHDKAMRHASDQSVLGDFQNAQFKYKENTA